MWLQSFYVVDTNGVHVCAKRKSKPVDVCRDQSTSRRSSVHSRISLLIIQEYH